MRARVAAVGYLAAGVVAVGGLTCRSARRLRSSRPGSSSPRSGRGWRGRWGGGDLLRGATAVSNQRRNYNQSSFLSVVHIGLFPGYD